MLMSPACATLLSQTDLWGGHNECNDYNESKTAETIVSSLKSHAQNRYI
jgi:hypothetical protein